MKRIKSTLIIMLLVALTFSTGCNLTRKNKLCMGVMEGTTYTNEYFGFTFTIPEKWTLLSEEEKESIMNDFITALPSDSKDLKKQLEKSKAKTLHLVSAYKYPIEINFTFNPNLGCSAEKLSLKNRFIIKSGEDYLTLFKSSIEKLKLPFTFTDISSEELGGKDFDVMVASIEIQDIKICQKFYSTIINGYALTFAVSYMTEKQLNDLNNILETIKFD